MPASLSTPLLWQKEEVNTTMGQIMAWITWLYPQDASGDLKLCPITSRLCNWCSAVCIVLAVITHIFFDYAETRPAVSEEEDPWMRRFLQLTATLALAGLIYELCIKFALNVMGLSETYYNDPILRTRLRLNMKMIVVFSFLTTCYHCMAADIQYVHKGWIAEYYGGHQIVYSVRYIEWVCCAPIVFSVSGQLHYGPDGKPRNGIIPSALLTGIYCVISWQGLVVTNWWASVILITWAFVGYFVASVEQLYFAWYIVDKGRAGRIRSGLLVYLVIMVGIYGVVFLLPIPGLISATAENKFYCIFDASFKLGSSAMLIATYDLATNDELRVRAQVVVDDLRRLIDTASVPIFGIDLMGKVDQWNMKAAEMTGKSEELALGVDFVNLLGMEVRPAAREMIRKALQGEPAEQVLTTMDKGIDRKATLTLSASSRRDKTGMVTGVTLIGCDLTEVELFKEAETRKARFMAIVSHELRSPLHGIIGLAERLVDEEADTARARSLRMVVSCASRLLDLVMNIMEMASLSQADSTGKPKTLKLQHDPVELPKIMEEIVTLVRNSVDKAGHSLLRRGVELNHRLRNLPIIEGDAHRLTQVFYNVITNACKFTVKGSINISSRLDVGGHWVDILVRDTGRGIPREAIQRIFVPFEQEDTSDTRHYEGVGLGLSIAREVVRLHGGHIKVESEVGVGTTFIIRLPTVMGEVVAEDEGKFCSKDAYSVQEPEVTTSNPPAGNEPAEVVLERGRRERPLILSVDDDEVNQMVIESILRPEYDIHKVMDGSDALEYLRANSQDLPDCVLLDVMMPGMSGFEVCSDIRQVMKLDATSLPVLMVTANPSTLALAKGFESGCNDYILKPFDKRVLTAHIAAALVPGGFAMIEDTVHKYGRAADTARRPTRKFSKG